MAMSPRLLAYCFPPIAFLEKAMTILPGEVVIYNRVWYKGQVCVNLIGTWNKGFSEPLWVMTNLTAEEGLRIYLLRMKIEQSLRDLKSLLGMTKLMNKQQAYMEKMLALLLMVFAIGLLVGERIRDFLYGEQIAENETVLEKDRIPGSPHLKKGKKWKRYSGLFVLLKQKWSISSQDRRMILETTLAAFLALVHFPVPTHV